MITPFLPLLMVPLSAFGGKMDGIEEADKINAGKRISHVWEVSVRIVILLVLLGISWALFAIEGTSYTKLLCVAGMGLGAFVPMHRYYVNTKQRIPKPWWWMGPRRGERYKGASVIDGMWHWLAWTLSGQRVWQEDFAAAHPAGKWMYIYRQDLPAQLAYGFDIIVLLTSIITYYV